MTFRTLAVLSSRASSKALAGFNQSRHCFTAGRFCSAVVEKFTQIIRLFSGCPSVWTLDLCMICVMVDTIGCVVVMPALSVKYAYTISTYSLEYPRMHRIRCMNKKLMLSLVLIPLIGMPKVIFLSIDFFSIHIHKCQSPFLNMQPNEVM